MSYVTNAILIWFLHGSLVLVLSNAPSVAVSAAASAGSSSLSSTQQQSSSCTLNVNGQCTDDPKKAAINTAIPDVPPIVNKLVNTGYGEPQQVDGKEAEATYEHIVKVHRYMYQNGYYYGDDSDLNKQLVDEGSSNNSNQKKPGSSSSPCINQHGLCTLWSVIGECDKNPVFMKLQCGPACLSCDDMILHKQYPDLKVNDVEELLETGYGVPQQVRGSQADQTWHQIDLMDQYMHSIVYNGSFPYPEIRKQCQNLHELCAFWSGRGECQSNSNYMNTNCAPACQTCHLLSFQHRCPLPDATILQQQNIWKSGNLNQMFERIVSLSEYKTTILSRPSTTIAPSTALQEQKQQDRQQESSSPWVIIIDDFLTIEECHHVIDLGLQRGYENSLEVGSKLPDGSYESIVIPGRTSTQSWCLEECSTNTTTIQIMNKMEQLTQIPANNSEYLQLLRYEPKQFYHSHHDYKDYMEYRMYGHRILTVFLYLNDVSEGGETHFPLLDITVRPQMGRALLWPSVYNHEPNTKDPRTEHEALPVIEGIKYGANTWFHQRDFKTPYEQNCV